MQRRLQKISPAIPTSNSLSPSPHSTAKKLGSSKSRAAANEEGRCMRVEANKTDKSAPSQIHLQKAVMPTSHSTAKTTLIAASPLWYSISITLGARGQWPGNIPSTALIVLRSPCVSCRIQSRTRAKEAAHRPAAEEHAHRHTRARESSETRSKGRPRDPCLYPRINSITRGVGVGQPIGRVRASAAKTIWRNENFERDPSFLKPTVRDAHRRRSERRDGSIDTDNPPQALQDNTTARPR